MGRDLLGLAQLAFASTALAIPGCGETRAPEKPTEPPHAAHDEATAPEVLSAAVGDGVLTLRFSKPVVIPAKVDPSKFRLTFGYTTKQSKGYSGYYYASANLPRTWYNDVGRFSAETTKLRQPAPNVVEIPLPGDFSAEWVCDDIARVEKHDGAAEAGLYLHYSEEEGAAIADVDGHRLHSVAAYWKTEQSSTVDGDFENAPIPVKLRCR